MIRVSFHPGARQEVLDATRSYRDQSPGLGKAFVAEVRDALSRIGEFLESGSPDDTGVRRLLLRRFPFALMYRRIGIDTIQVSAVMHHRRQPSHWTERGDR